MGDNKMQRFQMALEKIGIIGLAVEVANAPDRIQCDAINCVSKVFQAQHWYVIPNCLSTSLPRQDLQF